MGERQEKTDIQKAENCFIQRLEQIGLTVTKEQLAQFRIYFDLLVEWNNKINLTALTEAQDVYEKHFLDSVYALLMMKDRKKTLIDVGTGAGFPGIPLKIMAPELEVTLVDSLNKRIRFLEVVIDQLKLENINAVHGRAEDMGRIDKFREKFDVAVSRAVANLSVLAEYCTPFVKQEGVFFSYKSGHADEEVEQSREALKKLNTQIDKVYRYELPGTDIARSMIMIKKIGKTGETYPRRAGIPQKKPL